MIGWWVCGVVEGVDGVRCQGVMWFVGEDGQAEGK